MDFFTSKMVDVFFVVCFFSGKKVFLETIFGGGQHPIFCFWGKKFCVVETNWIQIEMNTF